MTVVLAVQQEISSSIVTHLHRSLMDIMKHPLHCLLTVMLEDQQEMSNAVVIHFEKSPIIQWHIVLYT